MLRVLLSIFLLLVGTFSCANLFAQTLPPTDEMPVPKSNMELPLSDFFKVASRGNEIMFSEFDSQDIIDILAILLEKKELLWYEANGSGKPTGYLHSIFASDYEKVVAVYQALLQDKSPEKKASLYLIGLNRERLVEELKLIAEEVHAEIKQIHSPSSNLLKYEGRVHAYLFKGLVNCKNTWERVDEKLDKKVKVNRDIYKNPDFLDLSGYITPSSSEEP